MGISKMMKILVSLIAYCMNAYIFMLLFSIRIYEITGVMAIMYVIMCVVSMIVYQQIANRFWFITRSKYKLIDTSLLATFFAIVICAGLLYLGSYCITWLCAEPLLLDGVMPYYQCPNSAPLYDMVVATAAATFAGYLAVIGVIVVEFFQTLRTLRIAAKAE